MKTNEQLAILRIELGNALRALTNALNFASQSRVDHLLGTIRGLRDDMLVLLK